MDLQQKIMNELAPSALTAIVGYVGAKYVYGVEDSMRVPTPFGPQSAPLVAGVGAGLGNLAGEVSKDTVLSWIPNNRYVNAESRLLTPALAGVGTYVAFRVGVSENTELANSFVLGAGSSLVGKYGYDAIKNRA